MQLEEDIHLKLRVFVVNKSEVELVKSKRLSVDFLGIGAAVTVGAKCNEVVIVVRLTFRPGDDVVNVDVDISAGRNGAAVPRLDEDTSTELTWYRWTIIHIATLLLDATPDANTFRWA
jgi:hypothetical protein